MTRFECPRCQHVFSAETADEQAFADCPKCSSLALPTDEPSDAGSDTIGRMFGSSDIPVTDEHPSMTSADAFQPPPQAARPGIFTELVGNESAPSFEQGATAVHSNPMASKMPASLFAAPPSLEGAPVDGPLSPFASAEGAALDAPEEDLYRAATEAFTPTSDDLPTGAAGAFGLGAEAPPPLDPLALTPLPMEPQPLELPVAPLPLAPGAAAAPWGGLPTPSSDGPVVDEPRGNLSIDPATGLQTLSPLTEMATEVDDRPEGLDAALAADVQVGVPSDVDNGRGGSDPSEEGESVFSGAGDAAIRPSILVESEPEPRIPHVEAGGEPPSGIIIDPSLSLEPASDPAVSSSFEDIDDEGTDLSAPPASLPESLGAIEASQEGAALDNPDAAALFAGANFDDLEAAFDEVADRATDPAAAPQEGDLDRAEDALRRASSDNFIYERPPDDDSDGLGVPAAPTAPAAPQLTLKKESQLPHLSLSQSTIEAVALPLHGGSFVTEDSLSGVRTTSGSHAIGEKPRYTNPALDEPTLVTRERDEPKKPVRQVLDTQVPKLMSGLTPLRVGALLFFACVLGTVFGALIAPGKKERPITARVRAENQIMEGNRAYEAGKLDDALGYYRGAVARDATYGIGHRAMASVLAKKKRDEEAARAYRTYLELTPGAVDEQQVRDILRRYDPKALPPQSDAATTDKVNK